MKLSFKSNATAKQDADAKAAKAQGNKHWRDELRAAIANLATLVTGARDTILNQLQAVGAIVARLDKMVTALPTIIASQLGAIMDALARIEKAVKPRKKGHVTFVVRVVPK